jgi:hypothetical protein
MNMNEADFCDGGIDVDEAVRIVEVISTGGIAAIEASGGFHDPTGHAFSAFRC